MRKFDDIVVIHAGGQAHVRQVADNGISLRLTVRNMAGGDSAVVLTTSGEALALGELLTAWGTKKREEERDRGLS